MSVDIVMPKMGESIMEGTILKWHKKPGDKVNVDETILEISTDKVDTEVPSPEAGTVSELLYKEGDVVEVGKVIAKLDTNGTSGTSAKEPAEIKTVTEKEVVQTPKAEAVTEEKEEIKSREDDIIESKGEGKFSYALLEQARQGAVALRVLQKGGV